MILTAAMRKKLAPGQFAGPGRSYPVNDAEHARKALQLAPRGLKAGNITQSEYDHIVARAHAVLKKKK